MTIESIYLNFPQLETERLRLCRITLADTDALFQILSDDEVTRYYDDATYTSRSQAGEQIESWANGFSHRRCIRWGIRLKQDDSFVGTCGFYGIHPWHMRGSIGYELARPFWRLGIMSEALTALLALGFEEMSLHRIDAVVDPKNVASIHLLEKLGFCNEGLLRKYENWSGDKGFVDLNMFALVV